MLDRDTSGFSQALDRVRPELVVLYDDAFNWFTKMCLGRMRVAARALCAEAHARHLPVIVAGHDAADDPQTYLDAGASFVIVGEAEVTLGELVARIADVGLPETKGRGAAGQTMNGASTSTSTSTATPAAAQRSANGAARAFDDINGLVFRERGFVRKTPPRRLIQNLDELPLPAWDLVDVERYRAFWRRRHGYFSLNVVTTRGCPYKCNWCAKPVYGNTYHSRSPLNVVEEMRLLRTSYAPDHLWFCDDILGLKAKWLADWSKEVSQQGLATPFLCQTRADLMTDENVRGLRAAGCAEAWLGAESGAQAVLDAMDKGITVEQIRTAARRLRGVGVRVGLFLQFGYPGEGWSEIQATRALVRDVLPDDIGISVSYPLPGTRFYERVKERLGEKHNWDQSTDLDPLFPGVFSRDFYQNLARTVHAEFRTRRGVRAARTLIGDPFRADGAGLRNAADLGHAGRWIVERARLEIRRRSKANPEAPRPVGPKSG
jgi:anaerobic magnesium-protoporphyrin IX monomethyl ester cyclase